MTLQAFASQEEALRRQMALDRESVKMLTQSLAVSNAEAEMFRRKFSDLQLRMEALGVESMSKDKGKLEQRLLAAVSDLQILQKEKENYAEQLVHLTEAVVRFLKTPEGGDPQVRMDLEAELRGTNQLLGVLPANVAEGRAVPPSLMDGSVISVKEEWSLVVGNLGAQQGVKMGMPLRVVRDERTIARLRVVDVREKISGAVIQDLGSEKEKIKVGDRLQVDARQNVSLN